MLIISKPEGWYPHFTASISPPTALLILILMYVGPTPAQASEDCLYQRSLDDTCSDGSYGWRAYAPAPSTRPALWQGLYVGADLGAGVGGVATTGLTQGDIDVSGFTGGLHAGYATLWDNLMIGVEFDLMRSSTDGDRTFAGQLEITSDIDWLSSSRLRIGYVTGDYLFYATGGLAIAQQGLELNNSGTISSKSDTLYGYALGGGVEMKLTESMSARIEAIHYGFGEETTNLSNQQITTDADVTTIRAGFSMHFN